MRLRGRFPALDVAFSPDGRSLGAGERDEESVTLWDLETRRSRSIFRESSGAVTSVVFSPDGRLLAAGPTDRVVRLWELPSRRLRLRVPGHAGGTNAVRFTPDGGLLVTSGSDGMVRIWKVGTGELVVGLDGDSLSLPWLSLSADGRRVAAAGCGDNHVRVWDLDAIDETSVDGARPGLGSVHRDLPMTK
jgi:WD40 repeat protein